MGWTTLYMVPESSYTRRSGGLDWFSHENGLAGSINQMVPTSGNSWIFTLRPGVDWQDFHGEVVRWNSIQKEGDTRLAAWKVEGSDGDLLFPQRGGGGGTGPDLGRIMERWGPQAWWNILLKIQHHGPSNPATYVREVEHFLRSAQRALEERGFVHGARGAYLDRDFATSATGTGEWMLVRPPIRP